MSRAALPTAPAATPSAPASSPIRLRWVCQGRTGASRCSSRARAATTPVAASREVSWPPPAGGRHAVERAGRAAELDGQADAVQVVGGVVEAQHPARGLQPERRRLGLLEQGAADDRRVAMGLGQLRRGVRRRAQVAEQRRQRALGHEHRGGVDRVLARRAVVHRRVGQLPQALDHRPRRVADLRRLPRRSPRGRSSRARAASTIGPASSITPAPACACASATSKSSSACSHARPRDPLGDAAAGQHAREDVRA